MSKRFGRNQKRRMRMAIAYAQSNAEKYIEAYRLSDALLNEQSRKLSDAMEVISDAESVLCTYSAALPTKSMKISGHRNSIDIPRQAEVSSVRFSESDMYAPMMTVDRLRVMLSRIDRSRVHAATHIRVEFGDKTWGYAISDMAIVNTPEPLLIKRISHELARMISTQLKASA